MDLNITAHTRTRLSLKRIREIAGLTTAEQARNMGYSSYRNIHDIEKRLDWHLSTIGAFISAAGGHAELVVRINGEELQFPIA